MIVWADFETASRVNIKEAGALRYAHDASTYPIVLAYAIDDGPVKVWHEFGTELQFARAPVELRKAWSAGAAFAFWNADFDVAIWNQSFGRHDASPLEPDAVIDVMAQAVASGLPAGLEGAAQRAIGTGKLPDGKRLIKLFAIDQEDPGDHVVDWQTFLDYAAKDVEVMRRVFKATRQLSAQEWREFQAGLAINARGMTIDLALAQRAAALTDRAVAEANRRCNELTNGAVPRVTMVQKLKDWVFDHPAMDSHARAIIDATEQIDTGLDDEDEEPAKEGEVIVLRRRQLRMLVAYLKSLVPVPEQLIEVLSLREYGAGSAPKKFKRMLDWATKGDPVLRGSYTFNGAAQTGRYSSRGVQVHNLTRTSLDTKDDPTAEIETINKLLDDEPATPDTFGGPAETLRRLALIVRPTIVAPEGKVLVWSDWANIEARVCPWLCGDQDPDAVARLQAFHEVDHDPSLPGMYERTAAGMYGVDPRSIDRKDPRRQQGKVADLACQFGGGVGALQSMAANYDLVFTEDQAFEVVERWRQANPWARRLWGRYSERDGASGLWGAFSLALHAPGSIQAYGRIRFMFDKRYLGGTMFMELPSGRLLTYASVKQELRSVEKRTKDPVTRKPTRTIVTEYTTSFRRGFGRIKLWPGLLAENATQAVAGDVLRGTLVRLESDEDLRTHMPVIAHTHDEVVCEVERGNENRAERELRGVMRQGFAWSKGLPLWSDETVHPYYTKSET